MVTFTIEATRRAKDSCRWSPHIAQSEDPQIDHGETHQEQSKLRVAVCGGVAREPLLAIPSNRGGPTQERRFVKRCLAPHFLATHPKSQCRFRWHVGSEIGRRFPVDRSECRRYLQERRDRASALRLITAVALKVTAIWSERRYLDVALLSPQEVNQAA